MRWLLTAFVLLWFSAINSQIKFEKGYFISATNERVECFIKNLDWKDSPTSIKYKLNSDDKVVLDGDVRNILEFGIYEDSKYKRFETSIEKSSTFLSSLTNNKNPVWQKETLFLKVLIEGEASLYSYTEGNAQKYFYETKNKPLEQLVRIEYLTSDSNDGTAAENTIKLNNQFRQQLYNNVRCETMDLNDFEAITYDKASLIKHFTKFNACSGTGVSSYVVKKEASAVLLKITFSGNTASFGIDAPAAYTNRHDMFKQMIFGYGFEVEYLLPYKKNKWSIISSPSYYSFSYSKTKTFNNGYGDEHITTTIKYAYIDLPVGLRYYMHLNDKIKLFIDAAFVVPFDSKKYYNSSYFGLLDLKSKTNVNVGFGISYDQKFSLELNSNFGRTVIDYSTWDSSYSTVGLKLAYKIVQF